MISSTTKLHHSAEVQFHSTHSTLEVLDQLGSFITTSTRMERLVKALGDVKCDDRTHSDRGWQVTTISINTNTANTARVLKVTAKRACTCPVCGPYWLWHESAAD